MNYSVCWPHREADLLLQDFVSNYLEVTEVKGHGLFNC